MITLSPALAAEGPTLTTRDQAAVVKVTHFIVVKTAGEQRQRNWKILEYTCLRVAWNILTCASTVLRSVLIAPCVDLRYRPMKMLSILK